MFCQMIYFIPPPAFDLFFPDFMQFGEKGNKIPTRVNAPAVPVILSGTDQGFPKKGYLHWVPVITNNFIHKNLLVISGTRCKWTLLTLMSIRSVLFLEKKIARYSRVLVVTKLVKSGTQCMFLKCSERSYHLSGIQIVSISWPFRRAASQEQSFLSGYYGVCL